MNEDMPDWKQSNWDRLGPPLRPTAAVVAKVAEIVGNDGPVLLLGVTPEFHGVWGDMVAVDRDQAMVESVWPGDGDGQEALVSDWMSMSWPEEHFAGIVCDGGLGLLGSYPAMQSFSKRCLGWLRPGGTVVHRFFCRTPPAGETVRHRMSAALSGERPLGFHAFKMLCNFAYAEHLGGSEVAFNDLARWFDDMFPDRDRLCAETGWDREVVDTIDFYRGSTAHTVLCTLDEITHTVPSGSTDGIITVPELGYDLWEWCPLLQWRKP